MCIYLLHWEEIVSSFLVPTFRFTCDIDLFFPLYNNLARTTNPFYLETSGTFCPLFKLPSNALFGPLLLNNVIHGSGRDNGGGKKVHQNRPITPGLSRTTIWYKEIGPQEYSFSPRETDYYLWRKGRQLGTYGLIPWPQYPFIWTA